MKTKEKIKNIIFCIIGIICTNIMLYGMYMIDVKNLGKDATAMPFIAFAVIIDFFLILIILSVISNNNKINDSKKEITGFGLYNPRGDSKDDHTNY